MIHFKRLIFFQAITFHRIIVNVFISYPEFVFMIIRKQFRKIVKTCAAKEFTLDLHSICLLVLLLMAFFSFKFYYENLVIS